MARDRNFWAAVGLSLLFPLLLFLLHRGTLTWLGDTDRYYHLAVSRMLAESHSLRLDALPQADNLGWGSYFPDKEFLFHALTSVGYRMAGERGAELASLFAASGAGITLFWLALGSLPVLEALACALAVFLTHSFAFRLVDLRPHALAVPLFLLLCAGILRRKPTLAAVAALLYGLAYHAFYLPWLALGIAAVLGELETGHARDEWRKTCAAGFVGSLVGLVANPYFPTNLQLGLWHAQLPFLAHGALKEARFGGELYPLAAPGMLKQYYFPFLILLGTLALRPPRDFVTRFSLAMALLFGALSFQTARTAEYFVPVTGLLLPLGVASLRRWRQEVAGALVAVQLVMLLHVASTEAAFVPDAALFEATRAAIAAVPPGPAKVFNCEWDSAPFLLQQRPDLSFVDLLDPSLLYRADTGLYHAKQDLLGGRITDPRGLVNGIFHAGYVLCRSPIVVPQLEADAGFRRVFPAPGQSAPISLYRVLPSPDPAFAHKMEFRILGPEEVHRVREYAPSVTEKLDTFEVPGFSLALGLRDARRPGVSCVHVAAPAAEVARAAGARFLGVGGGGAIRAWRGGKLLFASGPEYPNAKSVQALVRLEPPLTAKERIDLLVCSGPRSTYWAAALSFWKEERVRELCREKGGEATSVAPSYSSDAATCLGALAAPAVPAGFRGP